MTCRRENFVNKNTPTFLQPYLLNHRPEFEKNTPNDSHRLIEHDFGRPGRKFQGLRVSGFVYSELIASYLIDRSI